MPLFETECIVLKSYNLAEADRIVVFYTRDYGTIRGVAKGARRLKSKFGSSLEPFSIVQAEFFLKEDRELVSIQSVELTDSAFDLASDPLYLQTFSYLADLLTSFAPPNDPNEVLYRMVRACRSIRFKSADEMLAVRTYFELWLLRLGGLLPEWTQCYRCRRVFSELETLDLDSEFHLLCGNCAHGRGIQKITPAHRDVYASAQRLSPVDFIDHVSMRVEQAEDISAILKRLITAALGHDGPIERSISLKV